MCRGPASDAQRSLVCLVRPRGQGTRLRTLAALLVGQPCVTAGLRPWFRVDRASRCALRAVRSAFEAPPVGNPRATIMWSVSSATAHFWRGSFAGTSCGWSVALVTLMGLPVVRVLAVAWD